MNFYNMGREINVSIPSGSVGHHVIVIIQILTVDLS